MNRTGHNANRFGRATPGARSSGVAARHDQQPKPPRHEPHLSKSDQIYVDLSILRHSSGARALPGAPSGMIRSRGTAPLDQGRCSPGITPNYAELRQVTVFCEQPPLRVALNCTKLHLIAVILKRRTRHVQKRAPASSRLSCACEGAESAWCKSLPYRPK